jgi:predicted acylesterase/phospholipase RssA
VRFRPDPIRQIEQRLPNVHTGRLRIFPHDKITSDAIVASACLPYLFHAVGIDGVPYWDGGYLGNPSIFPLFRTTTTEDVLLVQINPLERHATPTTNREIVGRLNEITFGNLEKSLSLPIADSLGVNVNESERERNGIIRGQFCGVRRAGPIFRGAHSIPRSWANCARSSSLPG